LWPSAWLRGERRAMDRAGSNQESMMRARLIVSGRVQGVYFRASAREVAQAQRLAGWVRNRYDGDVETTVEGQEGAVRAFIDWCHDGPPGAHVTAVQVTIEAFTGEFHGFHIVG
jgi:acylphosphatase